MSTTKKYNNYFCDEDFTIIRIGDIRQTRQHRYYREIFFDKHPNPYFRDKEIPIPPVREFHAYADTFADISVGDVLHNVNIYSSLIHKNMPGKYYSLVAFDDIILEK